MKLLKVEELSLSSGMEYQYTSYPGDGLYLIQNGARLVGVRNGRLYSFDMDSSWIQEGIGASGGGVSEAFIFALIDKTVELVKMQPARSVRVEDHPSALERV